MNLNKKEWLEYIIRQNNRYLHQKQIAGFTNWAIFALLLTSIIRLFEFSMQYTIDWNLLELSIELLQLFTFLVISGLYSYSLVNKKFERTILFLTPHKRDELYFIQDTLIFFLFFSILLSFFLKFLHQEDSIFTYAYSFIIFSIFMHFLIINIRKQYNKSMFYPYVFPFIVIVVLAKYYSLFSFYYPEIILINLYSSFQIICVVLLALMIKYINIRKRKYKTLEKFELKILNSADENITQIVKEFYKVYLGDCLDSELDELLNHYDDLFEEYEISLKELSTNFKDVESITDNFNVDKFFQFKKNKKETIINNIEKIADNKFIDKSRDLNEAIKNDIKLKILPFIKANKPSDEELEYLDIYLDIMENYSDKIDKDIGIMKEIISRVLEYYKALSTKSEVIEKDCKY